MNREGLLEIMIKRLLLYNMCGSSSWVLTIKKSYV